MKLSTFSESVQSLQNMHYGNQLRPVRDWFILIIFATILLVFGALWNVLEFKHIIASKIAAPLITPHNNVLNGAAIQKVQDIFSARAKRLAKYESGNYSFADPSN